MGNYFTKTKQKKDSDGFYFVNRILVISSSNLIQNRLQELAHYTNNFLRISTASTLSEVDNALQNYISINIVIIDTGNPLISQYKIAQRIREVHNYNNLILSSVPFLDEKRIQRCLDCGINDVLSKPFSIHEFITSLQDNGYKL